MERRMKSEVMVVGNCISGGLFRLLVKSTVLGVGEGVEKDV
jgi:hypothetical protein